MISDNATNGSEQRLFAGRIEVDSIDSLLQRHSLRASLTFIRRAGIGIESQRLNGQTFYKLTSPNEQRQPSEQVSDSNDTLFAGIAPEVAKILQSGRNRALVLNVDNE